MKNTLLSINKLRKALCFMAVSIPGALCAQTDRWADGLYSTPTPYIVRPAYPNAASRNYSINYNIKGTQTRPDSANTKLSLLQEDFEFPKQVSFSVYPNPAVTNPRAVFTSRQNGLDYDLMMFSLDGVALTEQKGKTVVGTNIIDLEMSGYPMGAYYLRLSVGQSIQTIRFIKAVK
jgi:hypothetical protein